MTEEDFILAFREHKESVYRCAWRLTGSTTSAEDVTQDCFLTLWKASGRYDATRGPLKPFLLGIVRNLVLKRWRSEGRFEPLDDEDIVKSYPCDPTPGTPVGVTVANAVASLPRLQREVLILAEYEELSLEEIAQIVGAELTAVKSRLHRARENLRRMLGALRDYARTIE